MNIKKIINFHFILLIASFILFIFSCKDHQDLPAIIPIDPPKVNQIIIGDTTNMVLTVLNDNAKVGFMDGASYFNLDIDRNWIVDIRFYGTRYGLVGLGEWYSVGLSCISDSIKLNIYPYNDSIYISNDTTQYMQFGKLNIYISKNYICQKTDDKDIFYSITRKSLKCLHVNDTLKINDEFEKETFEIRKTYPYTSIDRLISFENKYTIIYNDTKILTDCHYFPGYGTSYSYVGLLMKDGKKQKLGWIKIAITNGRETQIIETALQK